MGKVCGSGCPYYGVDENYNGYCKKDHNSYRERFAPCNMESSAPAASSSSSSSTVTRTPRTCTSSCPYYGVDANSNGYCKKDNNTYRERFATCNMGETTTSGGGGGGSSGGCGCLKWIVIILIILGVLGIGARVLTGGQKAAEAPAVTQTAVTTAEINLRQGPSTSDTVIVVMPERATVTVLQKDGEWTQVTYQDHTGWCKTEYLEIAPTAAVPAEKKSGGLFGWLFG